MESFCTALWTILIESEAVHNSKNITLNYNLLDIQQISFKSIENRLKDNKAIERDREYSLLKSKNGNVMLGGSMLQRNVLLV